MCCGICSGGPKYLLSSAAVLAGSSRTIVSPKRLGYIALKNLKTTIIAGGVFMTRKRLQTMGMPWSISSSIISDQGSFI
jgi:hypothetical protein